MKSIKLVQDETSTNLYNISLKYSSKEKCKISVYYCATQSINSEGVPMYFAIPPNLPPAAICKVNEGKSSKPPKSET